jgi:hypothetical protein
VTAAYQPSLPGNYHSGQYCSSVQCKPRFTCCCCCRRHIYSMFCRQTESCDKWSLLSNTSLHENLIHSLEQLYCTCVVVSTFGQLLLLLLAFALTYTPFWLPYDMYSLEAITFCLLTSQQRYLLQSQRERIFPYPCINQNFQSQY